MCDLRPDQEIRSKLTTQRRDETNRWVIFLFDAILTYEYHRSCIHFRRTDSVQICIYRSRFVNVEMRLFIAIDVDSFRRPYRPWHKDNKR